MISTSRLVTLRRNPQYLTPHQMEALKASIRRDGFLAPVLVRPTDDGRFEIVSGNHRVMAAVELGMKEVPCLVATLNDQASARVAINLNTVHGEPNAELMAPFLAELDDSTLSTIHLEESFLAEIATFDAELRSRLEALEVPDSLNRASSQSPIANCVCKDCGQRHIKHV
jgi:ParB/RepB/Spo0J family partition protein